MAVAVVALVSVDAAEVVGWVEVDVFAGSVEVVVAVVAVVSGDVVVVVDPVEVVTMFGAVVEVVPGVTVDASVLEGKWITMGELFLFTRLSVSTPIAVVSTEANRLARKTFHRDQSPQLFPTTYEKYKLEY